MSIDEWTNSIHEGDAVEVLQQLPESSVHMVMTSPPYWGLRDYGVDGQIGLEDSLDAYVQSLVEVGDELRRVLRPDGSWWLNLGDTYAGGGGAAGKPDDWEDLHDDGNYPDDPPARGAGYRRKCKLLVPHRVAIALIDRGWIERQDCVWAKPNPHPESVRDRLAETKEYLHHLTPEPNYWFNLDDVREPVKDASKRRAERGYDDSKLYDTDRYPDRETVSRLHKFDNPLHPRGKNPGDVFDVPVRAFPEAHFATFPPDLVEPPLLASCPPKVCAECGTPYDREVETEYVQPPNHSDGSIVGRRDGGGELTNYDGEPRRDAIHYPGPWERACDCDNDETEPGIVLDPFCGAGTTCLVAKRLGRRFIGIDLNPEYVAMAQKRVGLTVDQPELLGEADDGWQPLTAFTDGGSADD